MKLGAQMSIQDTPCLSRVAESMKEDRNVPNKAFDTYSKCCKEKISSHQKCQILLFTKKQSVIINRTTFPRDVF